MLGALLPWGRVVTVFGTISVSGIDGGDGWITLLFGAALLTLALVGRTRGSGRPYAIAGLVCSAIVLLVGLVDLLDLSRAAGDEGMGSFVDVRIGIGLPLTVLAGLVGLAATILALLPINPALPGPTAVTTPGASTWTAPNTSTPQTPPPFPPGARGDEPPAPGR